MKDWVKNSLIIILSLALLVNAKIPNTKTEIIPEPIFISVDKESVNEVEIEKTIYIEVPIFIEVKPEDTKIQIKKEIKYNSKQIVGSSGFKSYMSYKAITKKDSNQYKLQQMAHTDYQGFRVYEGRYTVALGTGVGAKVGQFVDIVLQNGTHIPAVVGDIKSDKDTDESNIFCNNGCCTELIVENEILISSVKISGDCSYANPDWQSPVVAINVLERNVF